MTGIVVQDKDGNQFVWVPVANISDYSREDITPYNDTKEYYTYQEDMPSDEQASVSKYHGYYIGRYEAGDKQYTDSKKMRTSSKKNDTLTIKSNQAPYNYVTMDQANTLSTQLKAQEGYMAETKLCSSYAWDTAIKFMQKKVPDYGTNSTQGNYRNLVLSYKDIKGNEKTKYSSSATLIPTGETGSVCNIYDMGGNVYEWTTETNWDYRNPCVSRGGSNNCNYMDKPAGCRNNSKAKYSNSYMSFRVALFM